MAASSCRKRACCQPHDFRACSCSHIQSPGRRLKMEEDQGDKKSQWEKAHWEKWDGEWWTWWEGFWWKWGSWATKEWQEARSHERALL